MGNANNRRMQGENGSINSMKKINKPIIFKITVLAAIILLFIKLLLEVYAVDIVGFRVTVGLVYLKNLNNTLCDYYLVHGEYPEKYDFASDGLRHISYITYIRPSKDTFKIQLSVQNIFRKNTLLMANSDGVFVKDGDDGEWQRRFINTCKDKILEQRKWIMPQPPIKHGPTHGKKNRAITSICLTSSW